MLILLQSSAARIWKRLWSPGIDSEESIQPVYVAWRAGTTNRVVVPGPPGWKSIPGLLKRFTIRALDSFCLSTLFVFFSTCSKAETTWIKRRAFHFCPVSPTTLTALTGNEFTLYCSYRWRLNRKKKKKSTPRRRFVRRGPRFFADVFYIGFKFLFHRLNMEVDLQSLCGLHVTWCAQLYSLAETPQLLPSPRIWTRYTRMTRALLVSKDRRHLFVLSPRRKGCLF